MTMPACLRVAEADLWITNGRRGRRRIISARGRIDRATAPARNPPRTVARASSAPRGGLRHSLRPPWPVGTGLPPQARRSRPSTNKERVE